MKQTSLNCRRAIPAILGLMLHLQVMGQSHLLNSDWEFHRLDDVTAEKEIKNQGADWSSQYNVQHVDAGNKDLAIPAETLRAETARLASASWEKVSLPHTPFIEPLVVRQQWQGICYYRRHLSLNARHSGKRVWLEFEGAMHLADLWVNGKHASQHAGGYNTFVTDITDFLHVGDNELLVRLDNRNNPLIPPGKPLEDLDFNYFGGLYRDARLIIKDPVHITHPVLAGETAGGGVYVSYPSISDTEATVQVKTHVANTGSEDRQLLVSQQLYEWVKGKGQGRKVNEMQSHLKLSANAKGYANTEISVPNPRLWSPDSPSLYVLVTQVLDGKKVLDTEKTRIGIREVKMTKEGGCLINGKLYRLEGSNRHQEYPYVGYALSNQAHYRDVWQMRENGFNVVRLGHYPQDVAVLDACDELGLLAIEPIPGWQFFNAAEGFVERTYQDVRDMIRRDRNHPSILMWETTLNESWPPQYWKDRAVQVAHEEQPGCYTSGDTYGYDGFDVCYNDWAGDFNRPNDTSKPSFIREYYDYEFGGHYSTTRITRGQGDKALQQNAWNAQWSHNRYRAYTNTLGQAVWSMYDYNRGCADNICYSGVADLFRLPKFSLRYFRSQVPAGSSIPSGQMPHEVFVASHWMPDGPDALMVYGNVEEVALLLNGKEIARRRPDSAATTRNYVDHPDGGNATHVAFPPFTFFGVEWQEGEMQAVGYVGGAPVATHTVRTPGSIEQMEINYMEGGLPASTNDLLLVYVTLTDDHGTPCFGENRQEVTLDVISGGELRCPSTRRAEAGTATFVVATADAKELVLEATSGNMQGSKKIKLTPWRGNGL